MTDISTTWIVQSGTGDWSIADGQLASGDDLATAVLISLFTDRRATDDQVPPDGSGDRRGWWGDFDQGVPIGSRLWLLDREKLTDEVAADAKVYIAEALQWLIDDQVATRVDVATGISGRNQLDAVVRITRQDGTATNLRYGWAWSPT